jgi:hypothetical protein
MIEIKNGLNEGETILLDSSQGEKGKWIGEAATVK